MQTDRHGVRRRTAVLGLGAALWGTADFAAGQVTADRAGDAPGAGRLWRVGPGRDLTRPSQAARVATDGDTVEVDAGFYPGDAAVWTQQRLTLRAMGGRVRLLAAGAAAEGKAIWVMRGGRFEVQGFDFEGARVPGRNGAGIRFEAGHLAVRGCRFIDNEMGLLTSNQGDAVLSVESCEFAHNQRPDGHNHNLYVGAIARFTLTGSWLHHASVGHLLKSRAAVNHVLYNRLTDEPGGRASYELEFPNGGVAVVVGNLVQQGPATENAAMVAYGMEGWRWPRNELLLVNNTLVDDLPQGGAFLRVAPGPVVMRLLNNVLVGGSGQFQLPAGAEVQGNAVLARSTFVDADAFDYRPQRGTRWAALPVDPGPFDDVSLRATHQYVHPLGLQALPPKRNHPGAFAPAR